MSVDIPIIIITFRNDQSATVLYRAYSPDQWFPPSNQDDQQDVLDNYMTDFKNRIWQRLDYNPNGVTNTSNIGRILEIHTRYISVPLSDRNDVVYFYVGENEYTDYKIVKNSLPVFFNLSNIEEYSTSNSISDTIAQSNHDYI